MYIHAEGTLIWAYNSISMHPYKFYIKFNTHI